MFFPVVSNPPSIVPLQEARRASCSGARRRVRRSASWTVHVRFGGPTWLPLREGFYSACSTKRGSALEDDEFFPVIDADSAPTSSKARSEER